MGIKFVPDGVDSRALLSNVQRPVFSVAFIFGEMGRAVSPFWDCLPDLAFLFGFFARPFVRWKMWQLGMKEEASHPSAPSHLPVASVFRLYFAGLWPHALVCRTAAFSGKEVVVCLQTLTLLRGGRRFSRCCQRAGISLTTMKLLFLVRTCFPWALFILFCWGSLFFYSTLRCI